MNTTATQVRPFMPDGAWRDTAARQIQEHPIRSLAAALGIGFVLGGGLSSRFTASIVATGLRMAVVPLIVESLVALGDGFLSQQKETQT